MGKKKCFVDKKNATRFRLMPASAAAGDAQEQSFKPTAQHLQQQQKYGVFFDDDYDYMKHLRDRDEGFALHAEKEEVETTVIKAPPKSFNPLSALAERPLHETQKDVYDDDVDRVLEGDFHGIEGEIEDDFIQLAGGIAGMPPPLLAYRRKVAANSDDDDDDEESDDDYQDYDDEFDMEDEEDGVPFDANRDGPRREIDDAFDQLLEADYNDDQVGELDGDDDRVGGLIEPDDGRLHRLAREKRSDPEYDEQLAKDYVRKRMSLIEAGVIKEDDTELVEVDECATKRMKWDCESFASQYTNIYNHPTVIKDPNQCLSRRALKKLDRLNAKKDAEALEEEDIEMDDDDMSQCTTTSTMRPKGETPEERKLRKQAVKAARRARIVERKQNQKAFADAHRKLAQSRIGQIKAKPIA